MKSAMATNKGYDPNDNPMYTGPKFRFICGVCGQVFVKHSIDPYDGSEPPHKTPDGMLTCTGRPMFDTIIT